MDFKYNRENYVAIQNSVCVYIFLHVHMYCVKVKGKLAEAASLSGAHDDCLDRLASKLQGSSCFCLLIAGIIGAN